MKISIGGQDYAAALDASRPLQIVRRLNEPTACEFTLSLPGDGSLALPLRMAPVAVEGDDGTTYFTGYVAASPLPEYAGLALDGPRYRHALRAVSDELLLDQAAMSPSRGIAGLDAGAAMAKLAVHSGSAALSTDDLVLADPIAKFVPEPGAVFSKSAGQLAAQARASYRAAGGALTLAEIPAAVHRLAEEDGTLALAHLSLDSGKGRGLANDVTVCGAHEPAAYITEYFVADGVTAQFNLAEPPYFEPAGRSPFISELFNEPAINSSQWSVRAGGDYFGLGAPGLLMKGGSGYDGQTAVTWLDPVEMGGTLLLEAEGLTLADASTGIVGGFFTGAQTAPECVAGFQAAAQQGTGAVSLQPVVLGSASGAIFNVDPAHQYTLRIRVHCPEMQRRQNTYLACGDEGPIVSGGDEVASHAKLLFEIQEFVNGVAGMPVTLYDGEVSHLPSACWVVAASSLNLHGSLRALRLASLGSCWVTTMAPNQTAITRRLGAVAQAAECSLERAGRLVFYTGFLPGAGEQIAVRYRGVHRSVGRAVNAESQQALSGTAAPVSSWIGSVTAPPTRSSADCRNAAAALAQAAASAGARLSGTYQATSLDLGADVRPGDALALDAPSCGLDAQVVVRRVTLSYKASAPDVLRYTIAFANDWADDLAIRTSDSVPADAWLPAPVSPVVLQNLSDITIAVSDDTVAVSPGVAPPPGGGFEVRRRDYAFLPGEDTDLLLRGAEAQLVLPRLSANDRFYIRMFDGATPPNYSEFSAAVFLNLPIAEGTGNRE
ncbi:hypothetical protein DYQ86_26585 [Acidobacteria bacterium AB60]|nr:hypothetical protein DYQ86_26585 [Acidobacteria bacterium AB60]